MSKGECATSRLRKRSRRASRATWTCGRRGRYRGEQLGRARAEERWGRLLSRTTTDFSGGGGALRWPCSPGAVQTGSVVEAGEWRRRSTHGSSRAGQGRAPSSNGQRFG
ncbi:hypothetical protein P171DRAFT_181894 [Karstenula rhodostoma CBS 690.94]|uniref:Uncharacterized protein n=1 Tax=Karstenula rhodostoma CBS 690.94 TaxID=1392251 RepID=A0A9P4U3Z1_9PLEO|nr:hypothetical protein P171DRAFT_181894 [Karstenula rhodostoma CBS 690.94]